MLQVGELTIADPDPIPLVQWLRSGQRLVVEVSAVGRAKILDQYDVTFAGDASVARGGKRIIELDLDVSTTERSAVGQVVGDTGFVARSRFDEQPRLEPVEIIESGCRVIHPGRIRGRPVVVRRGDTAPAASQISQRTPRDPHQEEVQHGQEAELQTHRNRREHWAARLLLQLECDQRRAELDLIPRLEHFGPLDPATVDASPVGRAVIAQHP